MRVKLNVQMSGTRDGVPWPAVGSVVEVPDSEGRDMVSSGLAKAVDDKDAPEPAFTVPDDVEEATERFIPETAVHEPAVPLESLPEEDRRPNMDAIGLADDGSIGHGPSNPPEALRVQPVSDEPVDMAAEAENGPLTTDTGPTRTRRASRTPRASSTGTGADTSAKSGDDK